jgi:hypothetical protein
MKVMQYLKYRKNVWDLLNEYDHITGWHEDKMKVKIGMFSFGTAETVVKQF